MQKVYLMCSNEIKHAKLLVRSFGVNYEQIISHNLVPKNMYVMMMVL